MMSIKVKEPQYDQLLKNYSLLEEDEKSEGKRDFIEKVEVAIDTRPRAPTLVSQDTRTYAGRELHF